jgi:hypothetical protein
LAPIAGAHEQIAAARRVMVVGCTWAEDADALTDLAL